MDPHSRPVVVFRWVVFGLAGFYCLEQIFNSSYAGPGGPFRYLTVWALFLSFYSASRMLAFSEYRSLRNPDVAPSVAAVVNAMVVYLYWSLFLEDPKLVNNDGPVVWWKEYYLHLVGPLLQWIDAFVIRRAFGAFWRSLAVLLCIVAAYVAWAELFVGPMNAKPVGTVTSGLPYPFLNNMELPARFRFYAMNGAAAAGLLAVFTLVATGGRRLRRARSQS